MPPQFTHRHARRFRSGYEPLIIGALRWWPVGSGVFEEATSTAPTGRTPRTQEMRRTRVNRRVLHRPKDFPFLEARRLQRPLLHVNLSDAARKTMLSASNGPLYFNQP